jgi:Xaa-Pro aminopeptidase
MQRAANIADLGMEAAASAIAEGQTERVVAWAIEKAMREAGAEGVSFDVIVAAGANGAMPHHSPSDHAIQSGEPIVIDIGARYRGYCSDLTRTLFVGQPDDLFRKVYDIVLGAQLTAMSLIRPDMTGEAADSLARKVIDEAGYGSAFGHALGHGVGLAVHEDPRLGPGSTLALETGMVFSVEPGIYIPAKGGVRIEDMVVLEEGGVRSLSQATKTL